MPGADVPVGVEDTFGNKDTVGRDKILDYVSNHGASSGRLASFLDQLGLAPENLTTFAHFSVSSVIILPKSAGDPASTVLPRSASRAFTLGSARAALIDWLSLSIISTGVFLGAPRPYTELAS